MTMNKNLVNGNKVRENYFIKNNKKKIENKCWSNFTNFIRKSEINFYNH